MCVCVCVCVSVCVCVCVCVVTAFTEHNLYMLVYMCECGEECRVCYMLRSNLIRFI